MREFINKEAKKIFLEYEKLEEEIDGLIQGNPEFASTNTYWDLKTEADELKNLADKLENDTVFENL